jgi:uncharacterized protein YbbC (DUF1343 family)
MASLAPQWLGGCRLRDCWFEPTFHKHVGKLCNGIQIHTEGPDYDHQAFRPWRIQALAFKAIRRLYPDYQLWRNFPYEYERGKLAIDVINGGSLLREWVDDASATPQDLDALAMQDEQAWLSDRQELLRYQSFWVLPKNQKRWKAARAVRSISADEHDRFLQAAAAQS